MAVLHSHKMLKGEAPIESYAGVAQRLRSVRSEPRPPQSEALTAERVLKLTNQTWQLSHIVLIVLNCV